MVAVETSQQSRNLFLYGHGGGLLRIKFALLSYLWVPLPLVTAIYICFLCERGPLSVLTSYMLPNAISSRTLSLSLIFQECLAYPITGLFNTCSVVNIQSNSKYKYSPILQEFIDILTFLKDMINYTIFSILSLLHYSTFIGAGVGVLVSVFVGVST